MLRLFQKVRWAYNDILWLVNGWLPWFFKNGKKPLRIFMIGAVIIHIIIVVLSALIHLTLGLKRPPVPKSWYIGPLHKWFLGV